DEKIQKTDGYRTQINYPYWKTLAQAEQEERTVTARRLIFEAEEANQQAELDKATKLYEKAFEIWAEIFDDYPILTIDDTADDLANSIRNYMIVIDSEEFADDFPLLSFVVMMGEEGTPQARSYMEIRESMEEDAEKRRKELEAEEKKREEEVARDENSKASSDTPSSEQPDSSSGPDAPKSDDASQDESAAANAKSDDTESTAAEKKSPADEPAVNEPAADNTPADR
ncbi:MAG: IRE (iron responsive element), partial [Pirellulales bacterium]|nr:IRE (iron responsive element) [Pirellulales bacterium]